MIPIERSQIPFWTQPGMPSTLYPRRPKPRIEEALADTPVVMLNGPRQAGKATLATFDAYGLHRQFGFTAPARPEIFMERHFPDVSQQLSGEPSWPRCSLRCYGHLWW
jgi:hypothetical protein